MTGFEHYFDWAATSPADKEIFYEANEFAIEHWGNPSSIHKAGVDAKNALEECRKSCAETLNVKSENLFFTSGGTESDHLALLSILNRPQKGSIILSAIEHPALREMAKEIQNLGWKVIFVNPGKDGIISEDSIIKNIQDDTTFVSVMAVNNETGAIQPIYKISDALTENAKNKRRPFFHVDCVQAAGKIPLNLNYTGIDSAAFSAHKICGPRGIGLLYLKKEINSFLKGGGQEKNIRSGTENLYGAKAMSLCLKKYFISEKNKDALAHFENQKNVTQNFLKKIASLPNCKIIPECRLENSFAQNYSPYVVQASFEGIPGQVMERALSEEGFYISTGSACSSGRHSRPVLDSMGLNAKQKESAVRFSFGPLTTEKHVDELYEAVKKVVAVFCKI